MFSIDRSELTQMNIMPLAKIHEYTTINGTSDRIGIIYPFKYAPNGWRSWQAIASYKYQISKIFKTAIFEPIEHAITGEWTVTSFGMHFGDYIEFPKPYYPQAKTDFMSRLAIYATRLYFNSQLFYESLFAMALHFNAKLDRPYSDRDLSRKTASILKLDRSSWKVRLTDDEKLLSNKNKTSKASEARKAKGVEKLNELISILPTCLKPNGRPDVCLLSSRLNIGRARTYALLKQSSHITTTKVEKCDKAPQAGKAESLIIYNNESGQNAS